MKESISERDSAIETLHNENEILLEKANQVRKNWLFAGTVAYRHSDTNRSQNRWTNAGLTLF